MDLSFARFQHDASVTLLAPDLAVLLVGVSARQALSPTALLQARLDRVRPARDLLAPAGGAFAAWAWGAAKDEGAVYPTRKPALKPTRLRSLEETSGPPPERSLES